MPELLRQPSFLGALLVAAGAFLGAILGNVVRPLLDHYLQRRMKSLEIISAVASAQFATLYKPIYDLLYDGVPPGRTREDLPAEVRPEFLSLVKQNRHLAELELEIRVQALEEDITITGSPNTDPEQMALIWRHINRKYNKLRRQLGYPHDRPSVPWVLRRQYERIQVRWWRRMKAIPRGPRP